MRLQGKQLRFVLGSASWYLSLRLALLWGATVDPSPLPSLHEAWPAAFPHQFVPAAAAFGRVPPLLSSSPFAAPRGRYEAPWLDAARAPQLMLLALRASGAGSTASVLRRATYAHLPEPEAAASPPPSNFPPAAPRQPSASRWSGSLFLFGRPGKSAPSLAEGGQLGGSQLAVRAAYRLTTGGPIAVAAEARLYAPLESKGAEAAAGIDIAPVKGVPLRFTVERRIALDPAGRSAWSASAAGGFYLTPGRGRFVVDGYGQAGVVGLHARDPFVDGSIRAGARLPIGPTAVTLGGGLWGAAQPDLARLDAGPRIAVTVPVGPHGASLAVEGRFKIAGHARPGSGVALTLGADL